MSGDTAESHEIGTPFRTEVPVEDFSRIIGTRRTIENAKSLLALPEDKPVIASLIGETLVNPKTPNEVKLGALGQLLDLVTDIIEGEINAAVVRIAIDMIRAQKEKPVKVRMIA